MSNALAIGAVTAGLKDLIGNGLLGLDLSAIGSVSVSALPPDRITTGQTEPNQLNLFLYQVTPNTGWSNQQLPARDGSGQRSGRPPLALDLHYLLTAYGAQDLAAEALLGLGMQFLHETPALSREQLRVVLGPPTPPFGEFSALSLADQVEWLKITPKYLSTEELTKLWTAMQARYRPSMAYQVSVVLIESDASARSALPVLKRGADDRGPTAMAAGAPRLYGIAPAASDLLPAARLGDVLRLRGERLGAAFGLAVFESPRGAMRQTLAADAGDVAGALLVALPEVAEAGAVSDWCIGQYAVRLRNDPPPGHPPVYSNPVALALAPLIEVAPLAAAAGELLLTVRCRPRLLPAQHDGVRLLFGDLEVRAASIDTPADPAEPTTLEFAVADAVAGSYPVRLRVDGLDSIVAVAAADGYVFDPQQTVVVS
ncbi:DUF4255 domain-containing protein [Lysobacter sp. BMK333-48F3]|uniref:DUF4255 domain-containing protein n=1 Tax=Lysobacter sp. BMK333-48F3 TaxID=2867962 RepID=UPI001C8B9016|nr:DUF4255 domain-containing protein [Lysobacter sp. BMK333-48F3]MBX9403075.1 DUF4255 domain-containing protein [Lysobacter sp. BMK333-48F3]